MARKKNPNSNHKSGGAGFIITALILSSISGFSLGGILIGVAVGLGIGKIASIMGSGLDTTTHNREDEERRRREAEEEARKLPASRSREIRRPMPSSRRDRKSWIPSDARMPRSRIPAFPPRWNPSVKSASRFSDRFPKPPPRRPRFASL